MTKTTTNPLLETEGTPRFSVITPEHVEPALDQRLSEYDAKVEELIARGGPYTWENFVVPLEDADERISRAWGPVSHLNSVMDTDELREVYGKARPRLAEWSAKVGQDERVFAATKEVRDTADAQGLDPIQLRVLDLSLRDFRLSGVDLPSEKKERYRAIQVEMAELTTRFSENILDDTKEFRLVVEDPSRVEALPDSLKEMAHAKALEDDPDAPEHRWVFTLQAPSFVPFMQYQADRGLREQIYRAHTTRATQGERDNGPLIDKVLALRVELAELLGFPNFAELSLAKKMASSGEEVVAFLDDLAKRSRPFGDRDHAEVQEYAKREDGLETVEAYDVAYYRERLRKERYSFSDEELRQYFPLEKVLSGLFEILRRLYGIEMKDVTGKNDHDLWHSDVRVLDVSDSAGPLGTMFLDLFARDSKRGGAWMGECVERKRQADELQLPVAYLCCNFQAPVGDKPALLRHREVQTLFHECGHALHHVLTKVDYRAVSGISQVPWDGVELPSQFHENWCWQEESLLLLAAHHETGEPLPKELLKTMLAAKNFQSGAQMQRQLVFSLFDMRLHSGFTPGGTESVHDVLQQVREDLAVPMPPEYNRFENAFSHIFAGGYSAGYFSYKWAEVLAADAFSRFEEEGLFSPEAGKAFRSTVLEQGGSRDLMELYVEFRGRKPTPDALLRHSGLVST